MATQNPRVESSTGTLLAIEKLETLVLQSVRSVGLGRDNKSWSPERGAAGKLGRQSLFCVWFIAKFFRVELLIRSQKRGFC